MSEEFHSTLVIPSIYKGKRLDFVLTTLLKDFSREVVKAWIKSNCVLVNGRNLKSSEKIKGGEEVVIHASFEPLDAPAQPSAMVFEICFEDQHILVINKPAGLVVHPGAGNRDGTLLNGLLYLFPDSSILPRAGIVHRLDKNTSGLMVIAKTLKSYNQLVEDIKNRKVLREYEAIAHGIILKDGTINAPITRNSQNRTKMCISNRGKPAITHYHIIKRFEHFTLLRARLITGRTHQIRVHFSHIKHPLLGDYTYGGIKKYSIKNNITLENALNSFNRQALHAIKLQLFHPITRQELTWVAPLPEDMKQIEELLYADLEKNR